MGFRWLRIVDHSCNDEGQILINLREGVDPEQAVAKLAKVIEEISPCFIDKCFSFTYEQGLNSVLALKEVEK